jgi:hypothetical protein
VETTYHRICTYVSHISKDRDLGVPSWELQPLVDVLLAEAHLFVDEVERDGGEVPEVRAALEGCKPD